MGKPATVDPETAISIICSFLDLIGIEWEEGDILENTFLPGLQIENGKLRMDRKRLSYPGDLLHEAGHIALTKAELRATLGQDALDAQDPAQSEEMGVILWSYLAAKRIGIPAEIIFHAGGYKGQSNWLIEQFEHGNYVGLPLLGWMGITEPSARGEPPRVRSWLRVSGE